LSQFQKCYFKNLEKMGGILFFEKVMLFYGEHKIEVPEMNAQYKHCKRRSRHQDSITVEHHYRIDVFNATIDFQLL